MPHFEIDEIEKRTLSGLKDFQRATVNRIDCLFRKGQNRVLVADEVGLGKTLVAKGVIAKTARLRIEEKDELFKVIYICSNQSIANQNIRKLDIRKSDDTGAPDPVSETRLSMQHLKVTEQENDPKIKDGFVQLIPLTPDTSFRMTSGGGSVGERALMFAILKRVPDLKNHVRAIDRLMVQKAAKNWKVEKKNFENRVVKCEKMTNGKYPANVIREILRYPGYRSEIRDFLLNHLRERRNKKSAFSDRQVLNRLRVMFARISASMLEPDLVIMDEFQRFKDLLLESEDSDIGILAKKFLQGNNTRVLLLSATPYKLYSTLEEIDEKNIDEHYEEFFQVMNFLLSDAQKKSKFREIWKDYSVALNELQKGNSAILQIKNSAENAMYEAVCRTERISVMDSGDDTDVNSANLAIDENDVLSYVQMAKLLSGTDLNFSLPVDYAKSCPYLMSFMKNYEVKRRIKEFYDKNPQKLGSEREQNLLWLNRGKISRYDELPKTNARLEMLKEKAFLNGAEKYLWVPPSMPYYEMQGAYKNSRGFSKILVFSAWEMVPRMIGSLISYESERLTIGKLLHRGKNPGGKNTGYFAEGSRYPSARLLFGISGGEARGMNLFTLLYPSKALSEMYSPIESLNKRETLAQIEKSIRQKLRKTLNGLENQYGARNNRVDERWYYLSPMLMDGSQTAGQWALQIKPDEGADSEKDRVRDKGFSLHVQKLKELLENPSKIRLGKRPDDLEQTLVNAVLGSPAICIYRSIGNAAEATELARVFIKNFNLPESTAIIDLTYGRCRDDYSHWQNVLKYCKDGCFQAMIDEYVHVLNGEGSQSEFWALMESLGIHTATYEADTYPNFKKRTDDFKKDGCRLRSSFAVGFMKDSGEKSLRKENIRKAFNSPMRPFVLATTSIGQEGLDFHHYCRVIMHWNLPGNPIDLEQREGRINRFKCLAIRQSVADKYGRKLAFKRDIWKEMFKAASSERKKDQSELIPFWSFGKDQGVKIERMVPMYPMSRDGIKYERLVKILSLYRLTLGQARQEELLEYLFKEFEKTDELKNLFIDLSPFSKEKVGDV